MARPPLHMLDGRLIRLFLEVYETGSVSRAADRLDVTQSTVSHGLDRLRQALGDPLFVKDGRNITATPHADFLQPRMRAALDALEQLTEPVAYDPATDVHPFTIAANVNELRSELTAIWKTLRQQAPKVPVRMVSLGSPANTRPLLDSGQTDLVLTVRREPAGGDLEAVPFLSSPLVIYYDPACRDAVTTTEEFGAARHAVVDYGGGRTSIVDMHLRLMGLERHVHLAAGSITLLGELIHGTDLITTMQARLAGQAFRGLACCEPPFPLEPITYELIWHRRQHLSERSIWLREAILATRPKTSQG